MNMSEIHFIGFKKKKAVGSIYDFFPANFILQWRVFYFQVVAFIAEKVKLSMGKLLN